MSFPSREEAISTLEEARAQLRELVYRINDEQIAKPETIGGGDWSAKDLLGHIAFWEELGLDALAAIRTGSRPAVEDTFARGAEGIDEVYAANQIRTTIDTAAGVRARAESAHQALVDAIRSMSDEEWHAKVPYPAERRETTAQLLASVVGAPKRGFGHAFAHIPDLEAYVATLG